MSLHRRSHSMDEGPLAEVNTTPLIDVSLVLVVILLLATPLAFESSIGVRKGAAAPPAVSEQASRPVELAITAEDRVEIDGRAVAIAQLAGALRPLLAAQPDHEVAVSCDDRVSHGAFVRVLDIAKLNGAVTINVAEK